MKRRPPRQLTPALLRRWPLPSMAGVEGKEARGRVLVVGGCREIPGAVLLAGVAALRVGAGKLQVATVRDAALPLALALPEARVMGLPADAGGHIRDATPALRDAAARTDALLVGPGMDAGAATDRLLRALARAGSTPIVLDAGALTAWPHGGGGVRIITPHCGEMAGLLDVPIEEVTADPLGVAQAFAHASGVITVLKGATTVIAMPDGEAWIHTGGTVGLGTSGSGDVLAGAVAGLLARGASGAQAAAWAVHLHAKAGARLSRRETLVGFLAREIAWELHSVLPD